MVFASICRCAARSGGAIAGTVAASGFRKAEASATATSTAWDFAPGKLAFHCASSVALIRSVNSMRESAIVSTAAKLGKSITVTSSGIDDGGQLNFYFTDRPAGLPDELRNY